MTKQQNDCQITHKGKNYHCSISMAMDLVGGKWKCVILFHLQEGKKRFSELRKEIPDITEMALSLQLKQLEKDGLVSRKVYGTKPPIRVEYTLTELGYAFNPILTAMAAWSNGIILAP